MLLWFFSCTGQSAQSTCRQIPISIDYRQTLVKQLEFDVSLCKLHHQSHNFSWKIYLLLTESIFNLVSWTYASQMSIVKRFLIESIPSLFTILRLTDKISLSSYVLLFHWSLLALLKAYLDVLVTALDCNCSFHWRIMLHLCVVIRM